MRKVGDFTLWQSAVFYHTLRLITTRLKSTHPPKAYTNALQRAAKQEINGQFTVKQYKRNVLCMRYWISFATVFFFAATRSSRDSQHSIRKISSQECSNLEEFHEFLMNESTLRTRRRPDCSSLPQKKTFALVGGGSRTLFNLSRTSNVRWFKPRSSCVRCVIAFSMTARK